MSVGFIGGKFLPLHMGHVYAITKASCMCDELYLILSYSKNRDEKLCEKSRIKYVPHTVRLRWLSQLAKEMENIKVISVEDDYEDEISYNWEEGANKIKQLIGKKIDYIFSSEKSYSDIFNRIYPQSKHIVIDNNRSFMSISATQIREQGVFRNWEYIPKVVRPYFTKKVVVVGTESCGKSTLVRYLANLYNTNYVEEYGRTICDYYGGCDGILDKGIMEYIAYGHKMNEFNAVRDANKVIFIDSEAIITQYYSELYLGEHIKVIDYIARSQNYDLCLYLDPDVKWVDDGLRIHGNEEIRIENDKKLKRMLDENRIKYITITGNYDDRLEKSIKVVDELLNNF